MGRKIIETRPFTKDLEGLIRKRSLLSSDYEDFKNELGKNPEMGDLVKKNWRSKKNSPEVSIRRKERRISRLLLFSGK